MVQIYPKLYLLFDALFQLGGLYKATNLLLDVHGQKYALYLDFKYHTRAEFQEVFIP